MGLGSGMVLGSGTDSKPELRSEILNDGDDGLGNSRDVVDLDDIVSISSTTATPIALVAFVWHLVVGSVMTCVVRCRYQKKSGSCLAAATLGFRIVKAGSRVDDE